MLYHQFSGTKKRPFLGVAKNILCLEKRKTYFGGFVTSCCRNATTVITSPHITTMRSESTLKARKPMKGICRPGVAEVSQWEIHDILGESIWNMFHFGVPIRKSQVERRTGWDRSSHWGPNLVYKPWLEIHYSYKPVCGYFYTLCILYLISRNTYKSWLKSNNEPGVGVFGEDFPENIEPGLL